MATYYIDYNAANDSANGTSKATPWKRCPGMTGFAGSYSHSAGDIFVFKGGVTWPHAAMPLSIANSGTAGNIDTYTTDITWYTGGAFTKPILDDGGLMSSGGMIQAYAKSYFKIDGLNIANYGVAGGNGDKVIQLNGCEHVTITNCTSAAYSKIWIYSFQDGPAWKTYSDINFNYNDVSHVTSFLWLTVAGSGCIYDGVNIIGNKLHDGHSMMVNDVHADMIIHSFNRTAGTYIDNLVISRNHVYGDWAKADASAAGISGYIFQEAYVKNQVICNNVFTVYPFTDRQLLEACSFGSDVAGGTTYFVGNTIDNTGNTGGPVINTGCAAGTTLVVKNNIFIGGATASLGEIGGTLDWDYNCWTVAQGGSYVGAIKTYAQWKALGLDVHPVSPSLLGNDPLFTNAHLDQTLQAGSPCIDAGANLSGLGIAEVNLDFNGATRTGTWDIGAPEYGGGGGGGGSAVTFTSLTVGTLQFA